MLQLYPGNYSKEGVQILIQKTRESGFGVPSRNQTSIRRGPLRQPLHCMRHVHDPQTNIARSGLLHGYRMISLRLNLDIPSKIRGAMGEEKSAFNLDDWDSDISEIEDL